MLTLRHLLQYSLSRSLSSNVKPIRTYCTFPQRPKNAHIRLFQLAALASSVAFGIYLYPLVDRSAVPNSLRLLQHPSPFLASSGAARVRFSARRSKARRKEFINKGTPKILMDVLDQAEDESVRVECTKALRVFSDVEAVRRMWAGEKETIKAMVRHTTRGGEVGQLMGEILMEVVNDESSRSILHTWGGAGIVGETFRNWRSGGVGASEIKVHQALELLEDLDNGEEEKGFEMEKSRR